MSRPPLAVEYYHHHWPPPLAVICIRVKGKFSFHAKIDTKVLNGCSNHAAAKKYLDDHVEIKKQGKE